MKRLRESRESSDPQMRSAARLMARVAPLKPDAAREVRVRRRLRLTSPKRAFLFARPATVLVVFFVAMTATAMVGRAWRTGRFHLVGRSERALTAPETVQPSPRTVAVSAPKPAALPDPGATTAELTKSDRPENRPDTERHTSNERPSLPARAPAVPVASVAQSSPGALLMMEAMQARRAGDTARAARLFNEYRANYPEGVFQEEALALAIEAQAARGDPSASDLARTYVARFPQGRFRARVERVLRAGKP